MNIIGWLLFGLVVGAIAKFLMPGRDPGGWIVTILLGIAGSFVGGFLLNVLFHHSNCPDNGNEIAASGWIGSIVGAVLLVLLWRAASGGRRGIRI